MTVRHSGPKSTFIEESPKLRDNVQREIYLGKDSILASLILLPREGILFIWKLEGEEDRDCNHRTVFRKQGLTFYIMSHKHSGLVLMLDFQYG